MTLRNEKRKTPTKWENYPILFVHENIKKLPSEVGYFLKIEEKCSYCPYCRNGLKLPIRSVNLAVDLSLYYFYLGYLKT